MSKFIRKSRLDKKDRTFKTWNNSVWFSKGLTAEEKKQLEEEDKKYEAEMNEKLLLKRRIESKHLEEVSFKDIYEFPFNKMDVIGWVHDSKGNFIFQFITNREENQNKILSILNGEEESNNNNEYIYENGYIDLVKDGERHPLILIRGWGNLTGGGSYGLDEEYAAKIQDTLAEYIISKL